MNRLLHYTLKTASPRTINTVLFLMRVAIGILTIGHGYPKIMLGFSGWHDLGTTFMVPLGINFLPTLWGFLGAVTEFLGGIMFTIGFKTRVASAALTIMMIVAAAWHINRGDGYNFYSFPLTLIVVYLAYLVMGSGIISVDSYLLHSSQQV